MKAGSIRFVFVGYAGLAAALGTLIAARLAPKAGTLLHIHGSTVTGNLDKFLTSKGFSVRSAVLYDAVAADELSPVARDYLAQGKIHIILFFSPRTARTFVRLVQQAGLAHRCDTIIAICLSSAVAEAGSALVWGGVQIASTPDRAAMMQLCVAVQESIET